MMFGLAVILNRAKTLLVFFSLRGLNAMHGTPSAACSARRSMSMPLRTAVSVIVNTQAQGICNSAT